MPSSAFDRLVFYGVLGVVLLASIPYGSVEPWWRALFQCLIFALAIVSILERLRSETRHELNPQTRRVFVPLFTLVIFAIAQTVPWSSANLPGIGQVWTSLSVDASQTWLFVIHLTALGLLGWLLLAHVSSERRFQLLVDFIIVIGVVSAVFGISRQARQHEVGFILPYLRPAIGYAQFINYNHFAFLMEMALGLVLGIVVCRGVSGTRLVIYLVAALPMWTALILSNSRGGILSILCQVIFLGLLPGLRKDIRENSKATGSRLLRASRLVAVRGVLVAALLAGAIATVVLVGGDPLGGRLEAVPLELDQQTAQTMTLRQSIWRATWAMIKDHPIAGVGFGSYAVAIPKYHVASGEVTPQEAHNDYLELLASGGLIGFAICTWFAVNFLGAARAQLCNPASSPYMRAARFGALAGILTVCVHSLVDFGLHIPINAFVITALLSLVLANIQDAPKARLK